MPLRESLCHIAGPRHNCRLCSGLAQLARLRKSLSIPPVWFAWKGALVRSGVRGGVAVVEEMMSEFRFREAVLEPLDHGSCHFPRELAGELELQADALAWANVGYLCIGTVFVLA